MKRVRVLIGYILFSSVVKSSNRLITVFIAHAPFWKDGLHHTGFGMLFQVSLSGEFMLVFLRSFSPEVLWFFRKSGCI